MNNCGISRWDDPNEINARLKALTSQPIWEVTDEYYNNVILKYFDEKCKASKAVYEESREYIPGGVQHNLAFNKPFPMCMARADGAYLYDKDGNQLYEGEWKAELLNEEGRLYVGETEVSRAASLVEEPKPVPEPKGDTVVIKIGAAAAESGEKNPSTGAEVIG